MNELVVLIALMLLGNPAASLKLTGSTSSDRNVLTWEPVSWSPMVSIQRSIDYGEYVTLYDSSDITFEDVDVESRKTYLYRIQFNSPNFTMYSNEITLTR